MNNFIKNLDYIIINTLNNIKLIENHLSNIVAFSYESNCRELLLLLLILF